METTTLREENEVSEGKKKWGRKGNRRQC
jgi:hypothetical protein